jgi:hypothetical protein
MSGSGSTSGGLGRFGVDGKHLGDERQQHRDLGDERQHLRIGFFDR